RVTRPHHPGNVVGHRRRGDPVGVSDCCGASSFLVVSPEWVIFDRDEAASSSRHVGYGPESGSKISILSLAAMGLCVWWYPPARDSSSQTGASNHALRTQRSRMGCHQAVSAEQTARCPACERPPCSEWHLLGSTIWRTVARRA